MAVGPDLGARIAPSDPWVRARRPTGHREDPSRSRGEGSRGHARTNIAGVTRFGGRFHDREPGGNKATLILTGIDPRLGSLTY